MKKKYKTRFPMSRIKKIMQTDDEVGKVAMAVPILISKTVEMFLQDLIDSTADESRRKRGKTMTPYHLKQCISKNAKFDFLKEIVATVNDKEEEPAMDEEKPKPAPRKRKVRDDGDDPPTKSAGRGRGRPRKVKKEASDSDDGSNSDGDSSPPPMAPISGRKPPIPQQQRPPQTQVGHMGPAQTRPPQPGMPPHMQQQQAAPQGYPTMQQYGPSSGSGSLPSLGSTNIHSAPLPPPAHHFPNYPVPQVKNEMRPPPHMPAPGQGSMRGPFYGDQDNYD